jgi:hypothetical protein
MVDTNISNVYYQLYQAQVPPVGLCNSFSVSDNCQAVAFGHDTGSVHLFSKGDTTQFNDYSMPTVFADPVSRQQTTLFFLIIVFSFFLIK